MKKSAFPSGRGLQKSTRKGRQPPVNARTDITASQSWIVGSVKLPSSSDSNENTQLIVWLSEGGYVLNAEPCEHLDAEHLIRSYEATVKAPQIGKPGVPGSIRTSSDGFAKWLREHLAAHVQVILADTPELQGVAETVRNFGTLPTAEEGHATYFSHDVEEKHISSFFTCAASLYRAQPWRIVRSDMDVIGVRAPSMQIENAAAIVIGQNRQCYGMLIFSNYEGFVSYVTLAKAHANGVQSNAKVEFLSLNYERAQDLEPALRAEVKRFGWSIAGPMAYPWPIAVGENWATRAVSLNELTLLATVSDTLPRFLTETRHFKSSSVTRATFKRSYRVDFAGRPIDVELEFPHSAETGDDAA